MKNEKEIQEVIKEADAHVFDGRTKFPSMTYEDGVKAALEWVLGITETDPMAD